MNQQTPMIADRKAPALTVVQTNRRLEQVLSHCTHLRGAQFAPGTAGQAAARARDAITVLSRIERQARRADAEATDLRHLDLSRTDAILAQIDDALL